MFATTMIVVLIEYRRNGIVSVRTRRKLSHCQNLVGNHSGVGVNTGSRSGLRAAVSIQPTGSRMNPHRPSSSTYTSVLYECLRNRYRKTDRSGSIRCGACSRSGASTVFIGSTFLLGVVLVIDPAPGRAEDHQDDRGRDQDHHPRERGCVPVPAVHEGLVP